MKILIIGGDSFVAKSYIAFNKGNYEISAISRFKTNFENELVLNDFFQILDEHFKSVDVVINCAAIVHQRNKVAEENYLKINHELAVKNAIKAKKNGVKIFIQLSTIAVYGNTNFINYTTIEHPINSYGKSKLLADNDILKLSDERFKTVIFRPPMIYGGGNAPGNMMRLIALVNKGFPLPFKNAKNKRSFINIHNLVAYIEAAINKNASGIFLISDQKPYTTKELSNVISKQLNKRVVQFPISNFLLKVLKKLKPDVFDKLFGELIVESNCHDLAIDNLAKHSIEEGIKEMCEFFKNQKK